MKKLTQLNLYRDFSNQAREVLRDKFYPPWHDLCGIFWVHSKCTRDMLKIIASVEGVWDHVSVSLPKRCPNWQEMCQAKELFFEDSELVVQYHVPKALHINNNPNCLHLWHYRGSFPLPPPELVGVKGLTEQDLACMPQEQAIDLMHINSRKKE